jgi:hypothetical protein
MDPTAISYTTVSPGMGEHLYAYRSFILVGGGGGVNGTCGTLFTFGHPCCFCFFPQYIALTSRRSVPILVLLNARTSSICSAVFCYNIISNVP